MKKYKRNWLIKLGNSISCVGYSYQTGGFKMVYNTIKISILFNYFKFRYNNSKRFRDKIIDKYYGNRIVAEALLDNIFSNKSLDIEDIYSKLSEEEKDKFRESKQIALEKVIK